MPGMIVQLNRRKGWAKSFLILAALFLPGTGRAQQVVLNPYSYTLTKKSESTRGAVVSAHPLATQVGLQMLQKGGNAFDAAIATQLALAVVYPGAGNIGGGGFLVAHLANGQNISLDYREKAPEKASRDMFLDASGNPVPGLSEESHLAAGVPGTVAGLFATLKYAKLPFKKLIQPAIDLADHGFAITKEQADALNENRDDFLKRNSHATAFVKSTPWQIGEILVQKELAATLKRIRDNGLAGFYEGKTAELLAAEMNRGQGLISLDDLKNYSVKERTVLEFDYKNWHFVSMPLPSSGGLILQQLMTMIEPRNIGDKKFQTPESVQLMVEAERRAFADRAEYLGDPDFVKVPVHTLVSKPYLEERMKDFVPGKAGSSSQTKAGFIKESEETTHLCVLDAQGNAVSVTTTLNDSYGSKIVVTGAGFILNNEMDDFSVKPGVPNMYGALGNEKNAIAPGKRMLSSMTPTIVLENGKPLIVVGTPGGTTIPTSVFQTIVNLLEFGLSPADAVDKPKFHHQWLPDQIFVERSFPEAVVKKLESMGYKIKTRESIGRTNLIVVKDGKVTAIGDHRGDDDAEGY